jgi:hypothetical protein
VASLLAVAATGDVARAGDEDHTPRRPEDARTGALIDVEPRPAAKGDLRACSFRHPLCVHEGRPEKGDHAPGADALAWLDAADRAWDVATDTLHLPPPDNSLSPSGVLDVYLVEGEPYATRTLLDLRDPRSPLDRAEAFAFASRHVSAGCALDTAAARIVSRAILFGAAPATDEPSAIAEAASVAKVMVACTPGLSDDVALFQAHPELAIADGWHAPSESLAAASGQASRLVLSPAERFATGASLFYDWLDMRFGTYGGAVVSGIWALDATKTPPGAARWTNEPDGFDILRTTFKDAMGTSTTFGDLLLAFAVARASSAGQVPVRLSWSVGFPTRPRTVASGVGVEPTGAAYVAIDCRSRPAKASLRVEIEWEEHADMLWTAVRLDGDGRSLGQVPIAGQDRVPHAQLSLGDLDGVASVLVVGSNGGDHLAPYDPDDYRSEGHGWLLSMAPE